MSSRWLDLVDPSRAEVDAALPAGADPDVLEALATPSIPGREPRPLLEDHGSYVFGVLVPVLTPEEEATPSGTVLRGDGGSAGHGAEVHVDGGASFDVGALHAADQTGSSVGALVHRLYDDATDSYLDLVDAVYARDRRTRGRDRRPPAVRGRLRLAELRHQLLHRRRTVSATRASIRRIVDGRVDVGEPELFPPEVERLFADTYDILVRVTEELDLARDLLAGVRDHLQSKIAENQNEVGKKLTVIASLVLVPSFIVGFYGQNFEGVFHREYWALGVSVGLIVVSTLMQLALFRWRRWI